ncbi:MAG: DHH family phosphoesterase [Nanoarchaeota archaeon]
MNSKKQVENFLTNIPKKDKIALIFHKDLDGFTSGIQMHNYLELKNYKNIETISFSLSEDRLCNFNLSTFNTLIIMDIGTNILAEDFQKLSDKKILYIDHHQKDVNIPDYVVEYRTGSNTPVAKTVYDILGNKIDKEMGLFALIGTISDAGWKYPENYPMIEKLLNKYQINMERCKEYVWDLDYFLTYQKDNGKEAFEILRKIKNFEDIKKLDKFISPVKDEISKFLTDFEKNKIEIGKIKFYYFEPYFSIKGAIITRLSIEHPQEILIFATPKEDTITISARNSDGNTNMIELLKKATIGLKNSNAGGHIPAAGGIIQKKDLEKFKQNLKNACL